MRSKKKSPLKFRGLFYFLLVTFYLLLLTEFTWLSSARVDSFHNSSAWERGAAGGGDIAVGGGARNAFWMQNKADVVGRPIEVPAIEEATPLGAAILAGIALRWSWVRSFWFRTIHLLMIAVVRTAGVNNIIAIDGNPDRLETAKLMGADHTLNFRDYPSRDGLVEAVNGLTKGLGAHFAFQVTGVPQAASRLA